MAKKETKTPPKKAKKTTKKTKKYTEEEINNIETRLKDLKSEYDFNKDIIVKLKKDVLDGDLIVCNGNNTESASPSLRIYMDLVKTNMNLRKQINDMEILIQNGTIKEEDNENPFE